MKALSFFLLLAVLALPAQAAELNGKGIRKRVFFEVYEIALYLPRKTASVQEAISGAGPKRVEIRMLRDVGADQFTDALAEGIRANHPEDEARKLEPQVKRLAATLAEAREAKKGMAIVLAWDGKATQLSIDGKPAGAPIEGEDFYRALLRIWLGDRPVQEDLKKALLGG